MRIIGPCAECGHSTGIDSRNLHCEDCGGFRDEFEDESESAWFYDEGQDQ